MFDLGKINAAVIGSGNIGTDLMHKLRRSNSLRLVWLVGVDSNSAGLSQAAALGIRTTHAGIDGLLPVIAQEDIRIVFDATSAQAQCAHAGPLSDLGVLVIDLTPAALGPFCIPPVNLLEHADKRVLNVNMVTCGGQATIPIVHAISRVQPVDYAEIVATVASQSIGPGTRKNIDEFTRTTARAIESVANVPRAKAIILVNPANPPIMMRNTIHCLTEHDPDPTRIRESLDRVVAEVQQYVPGFRIRNGPVFDGRRVSVFVEVEGLGDYLPKYAGNLDIMTCAAVRAGEMFAEAMLSAGASGGAFTATCQEPQ